MSTPLDRAPGPEDPSPYAPKWAREGAHVPRRDSASEASDPHIFADDADPFATAQLKPLDLEPPAAPFRVPPSLDPTVVAEPLAAPRARPRLGSAGRMALAVSAAALVALVVAKSLPPGASVGAGEQKVPPNSFTSRFSEATPGKTERSLPAVPQLSVIPAPAGANADGFPLGLGIEGATRGVAVVISGLPAGATLSAGSAAGANGWSLAVGDLPNATIRPSRDFSGTMELLAELRLTDGSVVDRRPLRFERAAAASPKVPRQAVRQLDPEEIASLLKRGEDYLASGDIAAARLVLQRAAEAGDARAALALAGTFDPNVLEPMGVRGVVADVALALAWYEKAKDFGSAEAPRRLERLASKDH